MNLRPSGYEPDELPGCSTPRQSENRERRAEDRGAVLRLGFSEEEALKEDGRSDPENAMTGIFPSAIL